MTAPVPTDEAERVEALRAFRVLDTPPEPEYDDLARLAAAVCDTPISLVSLIDPSRQWFKSRVGLDVCETGRDVAFCPHAILQNDLFVVPDAALDGRFRDNPLVTGEPRIRFYAGMPLATPEGHNVGTLCVIDRVPRTLTDAQATALRVLARQVVNQLLLRRQVVELEAEVAARRLAEDALRESEAKFRHTVDRLAEGVFVFDVGAGRFADANAAVLAMLGYTHAEFVALDPFAIVAGESAAGHARNVADIRDRLARDGRCDVGRRQLRRKDGAAVPVDMRVTVVPGGAAGLHAVIARDVTDEVEAERLVAEYQAGLERANAKLKALSVTDGLTGVNNRAAFDARLAEEVDRAARHGRPLSVVLLDVDHFKQFNDTFGHPAGDAVLKAVAAAVQGAARAADFVARHGGEEFAVVLPDTDSNGAMVVAERFRRAVAGARWDKRPVTVSVGVSTLAAGTTDAAALVRDADEALYESKRTGRNRVGHGSGAVRVPAPTRP